MNEPATAAPPFRLKLFPLLAVTALGFGIPYLAYLAGLLTNHLFHYPPLGEPRLPGIYVRHAFQCLFALAAIWILKRFMPLDAGLRLPPGKSYLGQAIGWGIFFGVLMTLVDHAPQLLSHTAPDLGFPLTRGNVIGWIFFEGVYVGPTEEIPFRSMLVGYLLAAMPGTFRAGRFEMSWAGIVVAILFALAHLDNLISHPSWASFGQQIYAFALGVLYAYWFEKSRSVIAPIIGHNISDVVEYGICFALIAVWS